ncbi:hypothetical protein F4604DRAFT_1719720 [Suillus subluteus]|nr:hypothetical protein F4604DRAFT_1719720 [Suillus subluteus]
MASRPLIGGSLSRPADRFPDIFGRSELLKTYPFYSTPSPRTAHCPNSSSDLHP